MIRLLRFISALLLIALLLLVPCKSIRHHPLPERHAPPRRVIPPRLAAYDRLIRDAASKIDWDWRMVAAIVHQESRFNSQARAADGAGIGLMQINSSRYSEDTLLIPAVNLAIGTAYLHRLERMFPAAGAMDSLKFSIAAFNMGDGKLKKVISEASEAGVDATRWDEVKTLLPKGHRTVVYVDEVMDTYRKYVQLLPR